ncbi:MAG TPA: hypothetical protein VLG40_02860 [Candidatus Saccharimonas sp.]|nr:hypothetical protein [Candidatus Saccharimonas sp.]
MSDDKSLSGNDIDLRHVLDSIEGTHFSYDSGKIRLLDLLTGEPLESNVPPPSVLQNKLQKEGLSYLKFFGRTDRAVPLLLCNHDSAGNLTDLTEQHGALLQSANTIAIESGWQRKPGNGPLQLNNIKLVLSSNPQQAMFQTALHRWLADNEKRVLPCDYSDMDDLLRRLVHTGQQLSIVTANAGNALDERQRKWAEVILDCSLQLHRQWLILGQYGWWHQTEGLVRPAPLILGPWQRPTETRLNAYIGAPVDVHTTHHANNPLDRRYGSIFMDAMATCTVSYAHLDSLLDF